MSSATRNGKHSVLTNRAQHVANRLQETTLLINQTTDVLLSRQTAMNAGLIDPRRDYYTECGWPKTPHIRNYSDLYERDAIANRVVSAYPDECFAVWPEVFEDFDETKRTPWEQAVEDLNLNIPVSSYLHRVDVNAGIGTFGLLVCGFDDGRPLDAPILTPAFKKIGRRDAKLLWLQAYDESVVRIIGFIDDTNSPMHGMPESYQVTFQPDQTVTSQPSFDPEFRPVNIHWSRCLHVTTGPMRSSQVYAMPRLKPVLNRILDLQKCYGGTAEMLWKGGFMGLSIESLPDADIEELDDDEIDSIKKQINAYQNSQQRYIAVSGMTVKPLPPSVVNPTAHITVQLQAISAATKTPVRVLLGSEQGHEAGIQDMVNWVRRVSARNTNVLDPFLVRPFYNRMMQVGVLPSVKRFYTSWTDINTLSDKDKADVAMKKAQAISQFVTSGGETIIPSLEFWTVIMGLPLRTALAIVAAAKANKAKMATEKVWAQPAPAPGQATAFGGKGGKKPAASFGKRPARNSQQKKA